jgi:hypothetical protein
MVEVVNGMDVRDDSRVSLPRLAAEARFETARNSARLHPARLVCDLRFAARIFGVQHGASGTDYRVVPVLSCPV